MKSKSNPDFLKKDRSCVSRQLRNIRSKVSVGAAPGCVGLADTGERSMGQSPRQAAVEGPQGPRTRLAPHTDCAGPVLVASSFVSPCGSGTDS